MFAEHLSICTHIICGGVDIAIQDIIFYSMTVACVTILRLVIFRRAIHATILT
jgi:hypothetical protein